MATASPPLQLQSRLGRLLVTWILWRILGMGTWIWLLSAILNKAFGKDILPIPGWVALLPLVPFLGAQLAPQRLPPTWPYLLSLPLNLAAVVLYALVIAPIVWIYVLCWQVPRAFTKCANSFRALTHPITSASLLLLISLVWLGLIFAENEGVLLLLIYSEIALVLALLAGALRWAVDPLRPFLRFIASLEWAVKSLVELNPRKPSMTPEEVSKWASSRLQMLGWVQSGLLFLTPKLQKLARESIVPLFTCIVVVCYFLVATAYGGAIFAAQRLPEPAFSGLDAQLLKCWAYALTALTTSPLSNISPKTDLSYVICTTELICTFLILTVLFSMFSIAMGLHGKGRSDEIDRACNGFGDWLAKERLALNAASADPNSKVLENVPQLSDVGQDRTGQDGTPSTNRTL